MKLTLIILASAAVVLGLIAFFVVFYGGGTYAVVSNGSGTFGAGSTSTTPLLALSPPSSTASSTTLSTLSVASGTSASFATNYSSPPVTWTEGNETMAVEGASFDGVSQLTLMLQVVMGTSTECVPLNLRLLIDEEGDLAAPETTQFTFPESGNCEGASGATYNSVPVIFTVDPTKFPLFITTGGASNIFLEVATTSYGGVEVTLPSTQGG